MITVGNKHGARGIYVGRPSPLGNPFALQGEATRAAVIRDSEDWLAEQLLDPSSPASREIHRLAALAWKRDLCLVCFCAPKACHMPTSSSGRSRRLIARNRRNPQASRWLWCRWRAFIALVVLGTSITSRKYPLPAPPSSSGRTGFPLMLLNGFSLSIGWICRSVPDPLRRIKRTHFHEQRPPTSCPAVPETDGARFDPARPAWLTSGCTADTSKRKEPAMRKHVEIQVQSPAERAGFFAQGIRVGSVPAMRFRC